jgi:hypothetical protein
MATCHSCGMHKSDAGARCRHCGATAGNRLSDLSFDEISFVKSGANQKAHVVLWKSAERQEEINKLHEEAGLPYRGNHASDQPMKQVDLLAKELRDSRRAELRKCYDASVWDDDDIDEMAMTHAEAVSKILSEHPELYDAYVSANRYGDVSKEDMEAALRDAFVDVERLADQLQLSNRLTRAQAVAKALAMRSDVYDRAVLMASDGVPVQQESAR